MTIYKLVENYQSYGLEYVDIGCGIVKKVSAAGNLQADSAKLVVLVWKQKIDLQWIKY